ncbi:MAG: cell division protein FtsW [Anaerolineaceae bacterium]|nr:cell division protein FtsW [Anaerolineaceae bacterium]
MGESTGLIGKRLKVKGVRVSTQLLIDVPLIITIIMLLVFGLLMLYSASWNYSLQAYDSGTYILFRQIRWVFFGIAVLVAAALLDYHKLQIFIPWIMLGVLGMLILILIDVGNIGSTTGYTRTLTDGGSVQPSEFAKVAVILYLASYLSSHRDNLNSFAKGTFPAMCVIGIPVLLVFMQPDISAAMTIAVIGGVMLFISGGNMKHLAVILFILIVAGFGGYFFFDKVGTRVSEYIAGLVNPTGASYHIRRAYNAIINGGIFGVGIGKGVAKLTGLPFAWTDSIFAVILEETGLVGGMFVIGLYTCILWRGYEIFKKAPDYFGKVLAAGVTLWIFMEAALNICVILNIMPFAGNALPLISLGGSSMICTMGCLGVLLNISRVAAVENAKKGRNEPDAIINMRGGNWGWRVSRPGSSSGREEQRN